MKQLFTREIARITCGLATHTPSYPSESTISLLDSIQTQRSQNLAILSHMSHERREASFKAPKGLLEPSA